MGWETCDTSVFKDLLKNYKHLNPIRILAEGDSWFAYPRRFLLMGKDANIIDHLAREDNLLILNTASNGDEIVDMISGEQKIGLLKRLHHIDFDLVLLSGGGNDIVGRYDFGFLLYEKTPEMEWRECINAARLFIKIRQVELAYRELIERIIEIRPKIRIVMHTYDFPIPSDKGYELFDVIPIGKSWIYPYFMQKKIHDPEDQRKIIRNMLLRLKSTLSKIEKDYPDNVVVVNTQGVLEKRHWANEIHPTSQGFGLLAQKIYFEGIIGRKA
ncbi:MAG: SGNH/GDSL hydrolase family protein [Desulfobacterales bacterium]